MHGKTMGRVPANDGKGYAKLARRLRHACAHPREFAQAEALTPEFIDAYAIVGTPDHCIQRLRPLIALGLDSCIGGGLRLAETSAGIRGETLFWKKKSFRAVHSF